MILYKYRGLSSIEYALDMFVKKRLYAANFKDLNDPMEGRYVYTKGLLNNQQLKAIRGDKNRYNVLSLSQTCKNMLMWSYYAEGHSGFVVGVQVLGNCKPGRVVYDELVVDSGNASGDIAKKILMQKLSLWEHEKEYRVLVPGQSFVRVRPKSLIFGLDAKKPHNRIRRDLIEAVALKFCPTIKVSDITRGDLDTGQA